jgi:hypothetical protein
MGPGTAEDARGIVDSWTRGRGNQSRKW